MAKLFSVVPLELQPGVAGEDFVKFWIEAYAPLGQRLGWKSHVLKADRGVRVGQYAVIWEMSGVEARDRFVQADGEHPVEGQIPPPGPTLLTQVRMAAHSTQVYQPHCQGQPW